MLIGYGPAKFILGDNSPLFNYISLNLNYKFFTFSYFHGKLLGNAAYHDDTVTGGSEFVTEKYMGYHRIGFNISDDLNFGLGEVIIYGDRPIDLSYLNPFNFYKSTEHANRDRDNSMLFIDLNNKSLKGLKIYASLLLDDITFEKLGSGWYGNQTILNAGIYSSNLYKILPLDLELQYLKIDPYVYTHRLSRNNYTNFGYNLGSNLQPNSELFFSKINFRFNNRVNVSAGFSYAIHGANPIDAKGSIKNVGGNIALGHRVFDSETVHFLDGDLEYSRRLFASLNYEPYNQVMIQISSAFINNSLQQNLTNKYSELFLNLSIKL